jgi:hypothetical protein
MNDMPSIEEYRVAMVRIGRMATRLRGHAMDRFWIVGGLTRDAMDDALELERRLKAALEPFGLDTKSTADEGAKR